MEINPEDFRSYYEWLGEGLLFFIQVVPAALLIGVLLGYLIAAVRNGPIEGLFVIARVIATAVTQDLPQMSFRRTWAVARLAFKESLRRRVLVVFAVFAALFLFAGWFLDVKSDHPARLYLSFVLTATQFMVLLLALFLSVFSLPTDIKNRTIYTVVTKPVRANEIVVGRIMGFVGIGTVILLVMCVVSYFFVTRGLRHSHGQDEPMQVVQRADGRIETGETTREAYHTHTVELGEDGKGQTNYVMDHAHVVEKVDDKQLKVSGPQGALVARVPKFGKLQFLDKDGNVTTKGTNVGKVWEYRSYIEGGTLQAAIWTFEGLRKDDFPDGKLPLSLNLSVYRTHKGDIVTPVRGYLFIAHPDPSKNLRCQPITFVSKEFEEHVVEIPFELEQDSVIGTANNKLNLFDDLMEDGELEIWLRCDDRAQFFGVAQADVYVRRDDKPFVLNFIKGFIGIWLQMVVVVAAGVMFSTFLNTPVALLSTAIAFGLGYFKVFVYELWRGTLPGGGPVEALVRTVTQDNLTQEMDLPTAAVSVIRYVDFGLLTVVNVVSAGLPNFDKFGRLTEFVAYNYNIASGLLLQHITTTLVYLIVFSLVGYFLLKTREIAA